MNDGKVNSLFEGSLRVTSAPPFEVSVALRTAGGFLLQDSSRARASSSDAAAVETLTL